MSCNPFVPTIFMVASALACAGCAPSLRGTPDSGTADGATGPTGGGATFTENGDGTVTVAVDATSSTDWVYLDLAARMRVMPADPATDTSWHVGLQRFKVKINGGISGSGGATVAALAGADFAALVEAPAGGFVTDQADSADDDKEPDLAMTTGEGAWYAYDPATHVLTPRAVVYVLRAGGERHFKLRVDGYYDRAGTSGHLTLTVGSVAPPAPVGELSIDASHATTPVYLSVGAGGAVQVTDPAASTSWDVAMTRTRFQTNGGTSGRGLGGARRAPDGVAYDDATSAATVGFAEDRMIPLPGPPGSGEHSANPVLDEWYDYDVATHQVTPKQRVFLVRTATGEYGKLAISSYANGHYRLRIGKVGRLVKVETATIDASKNESWVYYSLRAGAVAMVGAGDDRTWDVGLSRTRWRTNGGTSGRGQGAAADPVAAVLAGIASAAGLNFSVDAMLPIPGPPGSGEFSGNPVLDGWYDYDPNSHAVSPKDKAFVVRTADGGHAKLKVRAYAAGIYSLEWAYAGPGRMDF